MYLQCKNKQVRCSRCSELGWSPADVKTLLKVEMIVTTAVPLMEARCWQVAKLAGNRPNGSKMFSERQDEEK